MLCRNCLVLILAKIDIMIHLLNKFFIMFIYIYKFNASAAAAAAAAVAAAAAAYMNQYLILS